MKVLCVLVTIFLLGSEAFMRDQKLLEWNLFKLQYNKSYSSNVEENYRMKVFNTNRNKIFKHNYRYKKGDVSFKLEMNRFGDLLPHELTSMLLGHLPKNGTDSSMKPSYYIEPANVQLANTVDWRAKGAVTPVKDQGHCGSCWAFSSTGSLEGQYFRKTGRLVSLSEQNLIDCTVEYDNHGCSGGYVEKSFQYIKDNHGIDTEDTYPYEAHESQCRYRPEASGAIDSGYVDIPEGDEGALKSAVATVGPVSVIIDASHPSFHFYSKGVYYEPDCSDIELDHAVLAVGYGTAENGLDYWLVKNSWGLQWGDEGYIKMIRNNRKNCGIASNARYPLV